MKKLQAGLIVEGNSTSSEILRLPSVAEELGPLKAGSLQVARRVSNFLRAGYAVASYEELSPARIILIRVPDAAVPRVVEELCASDLKLNEAAFVLCETWIETEVLQPLRERGACIASVVATSESKNKFFVVEGDIGAVRPIRRIMERSEAKTIELRAGAKHLLFAATALLTAIPVPMLMVAQQALREGGISGNQLATLLEEQTSGMLAGFLRASRTTWGGPLADCTDESAAAYLARLRATHPKLASALKDLLTWANAAMDTRELGRGQWA